MKEQNKKTETKPKVKTNIKLRVNSEQSKKIQEICITYGIFWRSNSTSSSFFSTKPFLYITKDRIQWGTNEDIFLEKELEEINPKLFIRTNGTCIESLAPSNRADSKPNLKIRDEFIHKVQNEKIGVICNTLEELEAWYTFLDKYMDKSLLRGDELERYITENKLGGVITNNKCLGYFSEWNKNDGFYERRGYKVYEFKDIVEEDLTNLPKETNSNYLVMVKGKGQPKKVHTSLESAEKEAKRLAKKEIQNGEGKEVFVLEVLKKYKATVNVEEISDR